jgi:hypothetical protein
MGFHVLWINGILSPIGEGLSGQMDAMWDGQSVEAGIIILPIPIRIAIGDGGIMDS